MEVLTDKEVTRGPSGYCTGLNNYEYYGSIFHVIVIVYGTSNGPRKNIGNY